MDFLLWTKGSHESTNFDTFKFSHENLPNSWCHFPNHKSIFLQILHDFSVPSKITPLCLFRSNILHFAGNGPIEVKHLESFEYSDQNLPNFGHFWNKSVFLQILHHSSVLYNITPSYFFTRNFMYFQQIEPIIVQIWWNFTWAVESLKFCSLISSFCKNHVKF